MHLALAGFDPLWLFTVVGGIGTAVKARDIWRGFRDRHWTKTNGHIERVRLEMHPGGRTHRRTYEVVVEYTYHVDGRTYRSDRPDYDGGERYVDHADAEDAAKEYPEGSTIEVYFDPSDPSRAVRFIGIGPTAIFYFLFFLGTFGFGLYWLVGR